jgi:hypothetical protein
LIKLTFVSNLIFNFSMLISPNPGPPGPPGPPGDAGVIPANLMRNDGAGATGATGQPGLPGTPGLVR